MSVGSVANSWGVRGSAGDYTAPVPEFWTFGDRCFGGYAGAVAIVAACLESGADECRLISAHVAFTRAVRPGSVSIKVEVVPAGRTVRWMRCALLQGTRS